VPIPFLALFRRHAPAPLPGPDLSPVGDPSGEVLALRRSGEPLRVLVSVQRERCPQCGTGVRTNSLWSTLKGRMEVISWCGHCFNAACERVRPTAEESDRLHRARAALREERPMRLFQCARHAVEHWERAR
jgi:hypothetical protein